MNSIKTFKLVLIVLFFLFRYGNCQIADLKFVGYFSLGYQRIDLKNLNTKLSLNNLPELQNDYVSVGVGFNGIVQDDFFIGVEGGLINGLNQGNKFYGLNFNADYILLNFGYPIYSNLSFYLIPVAGIGGSWLSLKIFEKNVSDFDAVISNPRIGANLNQESLLINLGLEIFSYHLKPYILGINFGYKKHIEYRGWNLYDYEISGSPQAGLTGFYLKFIFGLNLSPK